MELENNLPTPQFSANNPYWRNPRELWGWLRAELWPRNNAHNFLYASMWELERFDNHGAWCVHDAMVRTVRINLRALRLHKFKKEQFKRSITDENAS